MLSRSNILISIVFLFATCDQKPLPPSLWKIGNNKKKFQKVLDYYNKPEDSLKLKAAEFLIENIDKHFYYQSKNEKDLDDFFKNLDDLISFTDTCSTHLYQDLRRELIDFTISQSFSNGLINKPIYRKRSDLNTISSEFLIENIGYAFKAWDLPWARNYSFDEFCQYILPYRYGHEVPESWRKQIYEKYKSIPESVSITNDPLEVAYYLNSQFRGKLSQSKKLSENGFKLKISNQLNARVFKNCNDQSGLGVCILRSLGIPAVIINIPNWGRSNNGHELTGMLDSKGKWHYFSFGHKVPEIVTPPKIFFKRFDKMDHFRPILEDATEKLMEVIDLEVEVFSEEEQDIYLCVFKYPSWIPLCKGVKSGLKVTFENVGFRSNMYIAAKKSRSVMTPVSPAFIPDTSGHIVYFEPNHNKLNTAFLSRKYHGFNKSVSRLESLIGGEFSTSNSKSFTKRVKLYEIDSTLKYDNNIIECSEQFVKYVRYDFPKTLKTRLDGPAEISFYTSVNNEIKKIAGKYFGSPQLSQEHIKLMTDNNMLTYVEVLNCGKTINPYPGKYIFRKDDEPIWIGLEIDSAINLTHVGICPRNDKNGIYPEMRYELFYWDNSWKSLGRKTSTSHSVRFNKIPDNAVLWLRNLDEGEEERIFTLTNGKQIWW